MIRNMADRDLLHYIDESGLNVDHTPNICLRRGNLSRSRQSSLRKSGQFRKLYTPKDSLDVDENPGMSPESYPKRMKLSSVSHNATLGDGSHNSSSFDVVDVTPGINKIKSSTFQSYLSNHISVLGGDHKVIHTSMQHCKSLHDSFNKNDLERESPSSKSLGTHTDALNTIKTTEKEILFGRKESKSPRVSGITSLWAAKTPPTMSSKCRTPVHSVDGSSSFITDGMCVGQTEVTNHAKLCGLHHISELIQKTPCRTEQVRSLQKAPQCNEEGENELPATQPVSSLLLKGVVAYVEVRSGGDNRSMGIKAHLKSLGATVRDKFTNDVTHVVFNEGLLSTYKKAVKREVHLVSVSWIEECKKAQTIVSERLYPAFDMAKYESPNLLKRFRKVRSLQPDYDDMGEQKLKRRRQKKLVVDIKENEPEIKLPEALTYKKPIKVPEFLQNISNENGLVRTLLSVADIGPEYEEIVNRPDSPTLSEEEDFSIPLAVRLLRKILTPQSSPELTSSREESIDGLKTAPVTNGACSAPGSASIQETPKRECRQDVQRRNRDLTCNFESDKNTDRRAESANTDIEICNAHTEIYNSSKSPTLGGSDKVSVTKPRKMLARNILSCSKGSEAKNKYGMSSVTFQTTPGTADSAEKSDLENKVWKGKKRKHDTMDNVTVKNSNYKSGSQSDVSNSKVIEVYEREPVNTENLAVGMCSLQSANSEDQFRNNVFSGTAVSKENSVRKRKLLPLQQFNSPELLELDASAVTEEASFLSLQCPYVTERETGEQKARKALLPAGVTSGLELPCAPSTSTSETRRHRQVHKKLGFTSNKKHETVSKVLCTSNSSADEFIRTAEPENKPQKILEQKLPSLVCTSLHRHEVEVVVAVVDKLGGFVIEAHVSERTTHVVTKGPRRTVNLLKGIARGCWILQQEWVLKSLDADMWLDEDEYELADFSPAVQQCRLQKLSFGPVYSLDLFSTCGAICVSRNSVPPKRDLEELITLCGGCIVASTRSACVLVGKSSTVRYKHVKCVDEKWVLDSIQFSTLKPISSHGSDCKKYCLPECYVLHFYLWESLKDVVYHRKPPTLETL